MSERRHSVIIGLIVAAVAGVIAWRFAATRVRAQRAEEAVTEVRDQDHFRASSEGRTQLETARYALEVDPAEALSILSKVVDTGNNVDDADEVRMIAADAAGRGYAHRIANKTRAHGMAISADGFLLAVAGEDAKIHVWLLTGERIEQAALAGHDRAVLDVAFIDERRLISVDAGGNVRKWDLNAYEHGTSTEVHGAFGAFSRALLSPAGDRVMLFSTAGDVELLTLAGTAPKGALADRVIAGCRIAAWSHLGFAYVLQDKIHTATATGDVVRTETITDISAIGFDLDGALAVGTQGGTVRKLGAVPRVESRHAGPITALAAMADGVIASASSDPDADPTVVVVRDGQPIRLRGHRAPVETLVATATQIVSASSDGEVRAWVLPVRPKRRAWTGQGKISHASILHDGEAIALAHAGPAIDVLSLSSGKQRALPVDQGTDVSPTRTEIGPNGEKIEHRLTIPKSAIRTFFASRSGRQMATLDDSFSVIAWDLDTGGRVVGTGYLQVAQSSDGERIAAVARDNTIKVWRRSGQGSDVTNLDLVSAIAIDPTGAIAIAYAKGTFGLMDSTNLLRESPAHDKKSTVRAIAFTGGSVVAGADDGVVYAWDKSSNLASWPSHDTAVQQIVDGHGRVATIDNSGTFYTWDLAHQTDPMPRQPHRGHVGSIAALDIGDEIVTAGDDKTVRVWSTAGSRIVARHATRVIAAAKVGNIILSVDEDGTILETPDLVPREHDALRVWLGNR